MTVSVPGREGWIEAGSVMREREKEEEESSPQLGESGALWPKCR